MTETLLAALAAWGAPVLGAITFLSCLALPVPASLAMLAGGALVAAGDLSAPTVAGLALVGAVLGDQAGFFAGRGFGPAIAAFAARKPARARLLTEAQAFLHRRGGPAVFLSRWLFSPLGPYANLAAGIGRMSWLRFTLWGAAGEAVWVALYVGLGYTFADRIAMVADLAGNASGLLAALAVALAAGLWLRRQMRRDRGTRAAT